MKVGVETKATVFCPVDRSTFDYALLSFSSPPPSLKEVCISVHFCSVDLKPGSVGPEL